MAIGHVTQGNPLDMEGRGAAAPASSHRAPVPARTEKRDAEKTCKSKCRACEFKQARTLISSSSLPNSNGTTANRVTDLQSLPSMEV